MKDSNTGGFRAGTYTAERRVGERLGAVFTVPAAADRELGAPATVVRIDKQRQELAGEFVADAA